MLKLQNINWTLENGTQIIKDINLDIPDGKLIVITGPNGGGKTTLAKIIAGIEKPTSGKIFLDNTDISDYDITERAKAGISYALQQPVFLSAIPGRYFHRHEGYHPDRTALWNCCYLIPGKGD